MSTNRRKQPDRTSSKHGPFSIAIEPIFKIVEVESEDRDRIIDQIKSELLDQFSKKIRERVESSSKSFESD